MGRTRQKAGNAGSPDTLRTLAVFAFAAMALL